MAEEVRVWQVGDDDQLTEVGRLKLDLEERIEKWLEQDISVLDPNLLVIGDQVETAFGKFIDLLCMDATGNLVIVELKRNKTPRDVTAQAIDYASWVKDLEAEDIQLIAAEFFKKKKGTNPTLEAAFRAKFKTDFPEVINEHHAMRVVASEIDDSTERIIRYLSETYSVDINAAQFHFFKAADGPQLLVRTFTVALEQAEANIKKRPGKRRPSATPEEMEQAAKDAGVCDLYRSFSKALAPYFGTGKTSRSTLSFDARFDDSRKVVWALVPGESSAALGLRYHLYSQRLAEFIHVGEDVVAAHLPPNRQPWEPWAGIKGWAGYIKTESDIQKIADLPKNSVEGGRTS